MLGGPNRDRVAERREATRAEILDAAWVLAAERGLLEFTLKDLAERVGMRAPSLYTHFLSKHAIYDAMFEQAWSAYERTFAEVSQTGTARARLKRGARSFFDYAVAIPARHQLMNQRTIPGFEPSAEAYAPAVRVLERTREVMQGVGITEQADMDVFVALVDGLINQQLSNEPGGDRWSRLLDRTIDMWADSVGLPRTSAKRGARPSRRQAR